MGYFSNGTEGEMYREAFCDKCKHDTNEDCPIWAAHLMHNYDGANKSGTEHILHMLIPRSKDNLGNEACWFYEPTTGGLFP